MNIEFKDGKIEFNKDYQIVLLPLPTFILLLTHLNQSNENIFDLYKKVLKNDCEIYFQKLQNFKVPISKKLELFLEQINSYGLGLIKIKLINKGQIILIQEKPILDKYYKKISKKETKFSLEYFIGESIKYFISLITNFQVDLGISELGNKFVYKFKLEKNTTEAQIKNFEYPKIIKSTLNLSLKNIQINKHIKFKDGHLKLWGSSGVILPYLACLNLFQEIDDEFIENISTIQTYTGFKIQKQFFGINQNKKIVMGLLNQIELLGISKIEILEYDSKNLHFIIKIKNNNEYFNNNLGFKDDKLNNYCLNIIKSIFEFTYGVNCDLRLENNIVYVSGSKILRKLTFKEKEIEKEYKFKEFMNS